MFKKDCYRCVTGQLTPWTEWLGQRVQMHTQQSSWWTRASVLPTWEAWSYFPGGIRMFWPSWRWIPSPSAFPFPQPLFQVECHQSQISSNSLSLWNQRPAWSTRGRTLARLSDMKHGCIRWVQTHHISTHNIVKPTQQNLPNNKVVHCGLWFY